MTSEFTDRVAIITGGASGIGAEVTRQLLDLGAHVAVLDLRVESADRRSLAISTDVSYSASVQAAIAEIVARYGGIDILVNNAGIQHVASVEEFPVERWDSIIAINLSSVFHSTRLSLPGMKAKGWGRIVNIASVHGQVGSVGKAAYVAAKHGVIGLTKVVGLETATSNITCNAICPGWVLTPLVQKQIDQRISQGIDPYQAQHDLLAEKQPSLEFVTPPQLGELVLFLCSEAASQVRGAAWNVDGGWLAQ